MVELYKLTCSSGFNNFLDQAMKTYLVCGPTIANTQKRLLSEKSLAMKSALTITIVMEMAVLESQNVKKAGSALELLSSEILICCYHPKMTETILSI